MNQTTDSTPTESGATGSSGRPRRSRWLFLIPVLIVAFVSLLMLMRYQSPHTPSILPPVLSPGNVAAQENQEWINASLAYCADSDKSAKIDVYSDKTLPEAEKSVRIGRIEADTAVCMAHAKAGPPTGQRKADIDFDVAYCERNAQSLTFDVNGDPSLGEAEAALRRERIEADKNGCINDAYSRH